MDKLREELARAIRLKIDMDSLSACDAADAILPIIQRERMAAAEKVREACANGLEAHANGYTARKIAAQKHKQRQEARDFETMAMACAFRAIEIRALDLSTIIGGESDD